MGDEHGRAIRIAWVEDNQAEEWIFASRLRSLGFGPATFYHDHAALLTRLRRGDYDLVILTGADPTPFATALAEVRDRLPGVPVMLCTAYTPDLMDAHHIPWRSAIAYLPKPLRIDVLREALASALPYAVLRNWSIGAPVE